MRTLLIIIMFLLAAPCLADAENMAHGSRELLCGMMATQARMGIVICGIASEWRLKGSEFMALGEYGPRLAEAVEEISGKLPDPVAVDAPDLTKEREKLLREAAWILGEADDLILDMYEMEKIEPDQIGLLKDAKRCILGIFDEFFK